MTPQIMTILLGLVYCMTGVALIAIGIWIAYKKLRIFEYENNN